jgi:hypothetical protein
MAYQVAYVMQNTQVAHWVELQQSAAHHLLSDIALANDLVNNNFLAPEWEHSPILTGAAQIGYQLSSLKHEAPYPLQQAFDSYTSACTIIREAGQIVQFLNLSLESTNPLVRQELGIPQIQEYIGALDLRLDQIAQVTLEVAEPVLGQLSTLVENMGGTLQNFDLALHPQSPQAVMLEQSNFRPAQLLADYSYHRAEDLQAMQFAMAQHLNQYWSRQVSRVASTEPLLTSEPPLRVAGAVSGGLEPPSELKYGELPPMDLQLIFEHSAAHTFRGLLIREDHDPVKLSIPLTDAELARWNDQLRESWDILLDRYSTGGARSEEEFRQDLLGIAKRSQAVMQRVFPAGVLETLSASLEASRADPERPPHIQISAEHFFLPWDMFFTDPGDEPVEMGFWGLRYNISRTVLDAEKPITKEVLVTDSIPDVGFINDRTAAEYQRELIQELELNRQVIPVRLGELDPTDREMELKALEEFFHRKMHILHIGCHACGADRDLDGYFIVDNQFNLVMRDIVENRLMLKGNPLVILNACKTAINPRSTADFVRVFLRDLGGCGVIATEFRVPDAFAANFARCFYQEFLQGGKTVGESLRLARAYFLRERRNPLGLLYSAYVEPETCLKTNEGNLEGVGTDEG